MANLHLDLSQDLQLLLSHVRLDLEDLQGRPLIGNGATGNAGNGATGNAGLLFGNGGAEGITIEDYGLTAAVGITGVAVAHHVLFA